MAFEPDPEHGCSIADLLRANPLGSLETRILLGHALQLSRVQLITQSARHLDRNEVQAVLVLFKRRQDGEPIAYITGTREFYGLPLKVTPDVLIPRPETELLVELATDMLPDGGRLLDLGTGSGAVAVAIACHRRDALVDAADISEAALEVARENAARHDVTIRFFQSDWYQQLPDHLFDLIVANPPYIAGNDSHLDTGDLRFEPRAALTDHADGLSALRAIVAGAPRHAKPGSWLLMEHGYDQADAVCTMLRQAAFSEVQSWRDLAGIERISGGQTPL
jgi:release factor glutamine methyltransferase